MKETRYCLSLTVIIILSLIIYIVQGHTLFTFFFQTKNRTILAFILGLWILQHNIGQWVYVTINKTLIQKHDEKKDIGYK